MDILNFISWIKEKRVVSSVPDDALVPIGIKTETRDDKYTVVAIKKSDLISSSYKYEIGEYVPSQGGVVFHRYIDNGIQNYLVVDTTNLSTSSVWSNVNSTQIGPGAESTWDGLSNLNAIVGQSGFTSGAARLCRDSTNNSQNDWYLPAIDELSLLWQNRFNVAKTLSGNSSYGTITGAEKIENQKYWSSTEYSKDQAFSFNYELGFASINSKNNAPYVRAVRRFSI